ncbi:MAG TPA: YeeE/YedE family protein [Candidatus Desulfobacillus sp.]|nr:YeeE/YedE family protein [Candidatus Desulfobacillus sp.]
MEFTIHNQVLLTIFVIALVMGAVANKTNFCTMGAVSDWINMGDTGRLRAWLLSMAVAILGVAALTYSGSASIGSDTFPPYRTPNFAWLRYLVGGFMFGVGMTLGSGCGNKTLIRIGGGNLKSLFVLVVAAISAYFMLWTDFYGNVFNPWVSATTIDLAKSGLQSQALSEFFGAGRGAQVATGAVIGLALAGFVFASRDFRGSFDNVLAGLVIGLSVVIGWYVTAGPMGAEWREWAEMADTVPSRVQVQSFTFISPMGDSVRYLLNPANFSLINFGVTALAGVILGSGLYSLFSGNFRLEWFASVGDFLSHAAGAALMGIGGVLAMGCTIGQAITGVSTLAMGSFLTFFSIVAGAVATMKFQYWRMMREA